MTRAKFVVAFVAKRVPREWTRKSMHRVTAAGTNQLVSIGVMEFC
jgi:hypothetical protein